MLQAIKKCPEPESNQRHMDFQSIALPTELSGQMQYVYHMGNTTIEFFELQVKFEKGLRKLIVGINGIEFTRDAQIKYLA